MPTSAAIADQKTTAAGTETATVQARLHPLKRRKREPTAEGAERRKRSP